MPRAKCGASSGESDDHARTASSVNLLIDDRDSQSCRFNVRFSARFMRRFNHGAVKVSLISKRFEVDSQVVHEPEGPLAASASEPLAESTQN